MSGEGLILGLVVIGVIGVVAYVAIQKFNPFSMFKPPGITAIQSQYAPVVRE